jgi:PhzF family phenazine biosynthesis protein
MSQNEIPFYWLDSFSSKHFGGSQTFVCMVDDNLDDNVLSNIAKEFGVFECSFVEKIGESEYNLRWFTSDGREPISAVYATIAVTHTLVQEYDVEAPITFHTRSGDWTAEIDKDGNVSVFIPFLISMGKRVDDERILEALKLNDYIEIFYIEKPIKNYGILLEKAEDVEKIEPDQCQIAKVLTELNSDSILVTAPGKEPYDFVHRRFVKSREDYACGSAQAGLAPYWKKKLGKDKLLSMQPHDRVSELSAEPLENGVKITSKARILVKGTLYI